MSSSPQIELTTGFVLDEQGRIVSTREPQASHGPLFSIIRSATQCVWAVRNDVSPQIAEQVAALASQEPPVRDLRAEPVHALKFLPLTTGRRGFSGPAFTFPDHVEPAAGVVQVDDERLLARHFPGWVPGEIAAGGLQCLLWSRREPGQHFVVARVVPTQRRRLAWRLPLRFAVVGTVRA